MGVLAVCEGNGGIGGKRPSSRGSIFTRWSLLEALQYILYLTMEKPADGHNLTLTHRHTHTTDQLPVSLNLHLPPPGGILTCLIYFSVCVCEETRHTRFPMSCVKNVYF